MLRRLPVLAVFYAVLLLFTGPVADATAQQRGEVDRRGAVPELTRSPRNQERLSRSAEWTHFLSTSPGWTARWDERRAQPQRAQGPGLSLAAVPGSVAEVERLGRQFLRERGAAWLGNVDLELVKAARDRNGWWVQYKQTHQGLRVVGGRAYLRIAANGAVPLFGLETFPSPVIDTVVPSFSAERARESAKADLPGERIEFPREELVLLPIEQPGGTTYRLVHEIDVVSWDGAGGWTAYVDAKTGELVWRVSNVHEASVNGSVTGGIEPLQVGDPLSTRGLQYLNVQLQDSEGTPLGTDVTTDAEGAFNHASELTESGMVRSDLVGPFGRVRNSANGFATPFITAAADSGDSTANLSWNNGNSLVQDRDAWYWAMQSHDYIKNELEADFDLLDYEMPIITDLTNTDPEEAAFECNAFWNGVGITFYPASAPPSTRGCTNTARSASVVIHEYGHGLTDLQYRPFRPSGAMHEGFSDYFSATILNTPTVGHGFFGRGSSIRTIQNTRRVPDDVVGQVHTDGLIIGGALWDVRQLLGRETTDHLWHFARYGFADNFDDYFFDFLVTDDDDGNVYNGTPNFTAIVNSFRAHGIGDYSIQVSHSPLKDTEDTESTFDLTASFLSIFSIDPASVMVHLEVTAGGDTTPETRVMTATGGIREYVSTLDAMAEGTVVRYWFTAEDVDAQSVTYPEGGSDEAFSFTVGPDSTPPVITHVPLADQPVDNDGVRVRATVTDNLDLGVGSVVSNWARNGDSGGEALDLVNMEGDRWEVELPLGSPSVGDAITYDIVAVDQASALNETADPSAGSHAFNIVRGVGRDFEANDGGFTAPGGANDWNRGDPQPLADAWSGENVWATNTAGAYRDGSESFLVVGPLDLSDFTRAALVFRHFYRIEAFFDGGTVLASTNGTDWSVLEPDGGYPYPFLIVSGLPGFSGAQEEWTEASFDLSAFRGESQVWFDFRFLSDEGLTDLGWYLDDVQVVERQILVRPLGISPVSGRDGVVPVTWPAPSGVVEGEGSPILGYHLYRASGIDPLVRVTTEPLADRSYEDTDVVNGTFYSYAVSAVYAEGESPMSVIADAIPFVARYQGGGDEVAVQLEENQSTQELFSVANEGTGFLRVNAWPAFPGQTIDDVRILYAIPGAQKPAPADALQTRVAPPNKTGTAAPADFGELSALLRTARPAVRTPSVRHASIPPTGDYVLLHTDADDLNHATIPDLRTVEALVEGGSLYLKITTHEPWGNPDEDFTLAFGFDTDLNVETGSFFGEFTLLAGAFPQLQFGQPAVLLDEFFGSAGGPHHVVFDADSDTAEFGFFLPQIGSPAAMFLAVATADPFLNNTPDVAPDEIGISWLDTPQRFLEVFQGESEDLALDFNSGILGENTYRAQLLLDTNDPDMATITLPVSMRVGDPTPVSLMGLRVEATDLGGRLTWETAGEREHAGFHVYRRAVDAGEEIRINESLITAADGRYHFDDTDLDPGQWLYRVADVSRSGEVTFHGPVLLRFAGATALTAPVLRQNMPNPVRGSTRIRFGLPEAQPVSIQVFAVDGRLVRTLATGTTHGPGFHEVVWDATTDGGQKVAAGIYTYRLVTPGHVEHRKMLVVR